MLLVIAALALVVWPWANQQTQELRTATAGAATSSAWRPASSRSRPAARRVFFLDKDTPDNKSRQRTSSSRPIEHGKRDRHLGAQRPDRDHRRQPAPDAVATASGWRTARRPGSCRSASSRNYGSQRRRQRAGGARRTGRRKTRSTLDLLREPTRGQPGRAGLAPRHGAGGDQLRGARAHGVQRQPARRAAAATWCSPCSPSSSTSTC